MMKNARGFTLIELMIIVTIVGLLASIATPNYIAMQNASRRAELPTIVGGLYEAEIAYFSANDTYLLVTTPEPRTTPNRQLVAWPSGTDFETLGWRPDGMVRGIYMVESDGSDAFRAVGQSDVDNDGVVAEFYATKSEGVSRATPQNIF